MKINKIIDKVLHSKKDDSNNKTTSRSFGEMIYLFEQEELKRPAILKKIRRVYYFVIKFPSWIRGQYLSLKHAIHWLPIIWNDRDWDSGYLLKIMKFKITNMRKHHERYRFFVGVDAVILQLKTCEITLERLMADDYCEDIYSKYPMKKDKPWEVDIPENKGLEFRLLTKANHKKARAKRRSDENIFFNTFRKHYRKWWD